MAGRRLLPLICLLTTAASARDEPGYVLNGSELARGMTLDRPGSYHA